MFVDVREVAKTRQKIYIPRYHQVLGWMAIAAKVVTIDFLSSV